MGDREMTKTTVISSMSAFDGTFWRIRYSNPALAQVNEVTWTRYYSRDAVIEAAAVFRKYGVLKDVRIVRIRPRMSIVRAVRLLTEARKQGVELWMRSAPETWGWLSHDDRGWIHMLSDGRVVEFNLRPCLTLKKWIVATPEDARKIDARMARK